MHSRQRRPCIAHLPMCLGVVQWRATKDFRDITFLGPRIVDKLALSLIIMTLYWRVGENHKLSNYNNLAAVLFLWTILPGYAAAAFIPTIVLERPLFVRLAFLYFALPFIVEALQDCIPYHAYLLLPSVFCNTSPALLSHCLRTQGRFTLPAA